MSGTGNESPSNTWVRSPDDPPIIDMYGNSWAISRRGQVVIDGEHDRQTSDVTELVYLNRLVWMWKASEQLWWHKGGFAQPWLPPEGTPTAPFGPTPDPRIDVLIQAVAAIAQQINLLGSMLGGSLQNLQNDVNELPTEIPPDPQIGDLASALSAFINNTTAALTAINLQLNAQAAFAQANQDTLAAWWATLETQMAALQTSADAAAISLNRIIVMMLALFPAGKQTQIATGELKIVGTQAAPLATGP